MKLQEAISILKIHQQWRLGADIVMIEPKELTQAIDTLLNYHIVDINEMEKQQIIDAWKDGYGGDAHDENEYYNETYGSKGSETK